MVYRINIYIKEGIYLSGNYVCVKIQSLYTADCKVIDMKKIKNVKVQGCRFGNGRCLTVVSYLQRLC